MHPLHVMIESQRHQARHQHYPARSSRRKPLSVAAVAAILLVGAIAVAALAGVVA
jgi:hypothetical protein